jgi:hypothetical protein
MSNYQYAFLLRLETALLSPRPMIRVLKHLVCLLCFISPRHSAFLSHGYRMETAMRGEVKTMKSIFAFCELLLYPFGIKVLIDSL